MNRWKKVLLIITGVLLILIGIAWAGAYLYEDEVKNLIITNINKNLNTPVKVKDMQFSFIRKFPYATLEFTDIVIDGPGYKELNKSLFKAHKLNLNFSLWDVFGKGITLKKIEVSDGSAFIHVSKTGEENYNIWKSNNENKKTDFDLAIREIQLRDVHINYVNKASSQDYSAQISGGTLGGEFGNDEYDLHAKTTMNMEHFIADGVNYIQEREIASSFSLHVNLVSNIYTINNAQVSIDDLKLNTTGNIIHLNEGNKIALTIQSEGAGLKELIQMFPDHSTKELNKYEFKGKINFTATINGLSSKMKTPMVKIDFSSGSTSVKPVNSDFVLDKMQFKGFYTNRFSAAYPVSYLSLSQFSSYLDKQPVSGNISFTDLSNPMVNGNLAGNIDLATLSAFYRPDTIANMAGKAKINLKFEGQSGNTAGYTSSGTVDLQNVSFTLKQKAAVFEEFNGKFIFNGNRFNIENLNGRAAGSDIKVNGSIDNFFSFIFQKNQILQGRAQLVSRNLDLNELLEDKKKTTSNDTAYFLDINEHFNVLLEVNVGVITFRKFQAWNLKGNISVNDKVLSTDNLSFKTMSGNMSITGAINARQPNNVLISCNAKAGKIDIRELFYETGNFGQAVIKDNNISGLLTANIDFTGVWTKSLHCDLDKIKVRSDFTIEKGELIKFEPIMALSRYLKGADLQLIKFSEIKNNITIDRQKIYIPSMDIKSSALELTASGTHTFDNIVDYRLQLLLSQVTGKKVKAMNTEFGTIEDDGYGRTKIFLTMKGPMADPKIKYDTKGTEEKIVNDIKQENKNIKQILNKEFGWFKKDSAAVKTNTQKNKKEELQIERGESDDEK